MAGRGDGSEGSVPDLTGVRLDEGYVLLAAQRTGKVATSYEAESLRDGERVIVEVLLPAFTRSRRHVERFLEAARIGAGLHHPNIAAVLDCGRVPGGGVYFAQARLEGTRLRRILAERGGIPWAEAKPWITQLIDALEAAQGLGVVHGGVAPGRCWLVDGEGDPARAQLLVTGFGLFGGPRDPWPVPEPYRAPELERGDEVSPSSDVFAAGALAYEVLSGVPWSKAGHGTTTGLRELVPGLPSVVDRVLAQALHPDPAQRFSSARALAAAFRKAAVPTRHPRLDMLDEEITAVHAGERERPSALSLVVTSPVPLGPRAAHGPQGTVRLDPARLRPTPREHTVLLPTDDLPPDEGHPVPAQAGASGSGWGTVVLPGGGHPEHAADRTLPLAIDEAPDDPSEEIRVTAVRSTSFALPRPIATTSTESLPGMGGSRLDAPEVWPAAPVVAAMTPTASHPVISGPYPVVGPTPTGGSPVVRRPNPRGRRRQGPPAPTGGHPALRTASDETTRLAWGFLVGVLITVAIVGGAIALALWLSRG
jgi:Protein kinase domain